MVLEQFPARPEADVVSRFVSRLFSSSGVRGRVELAWSDIHPPHRPQYAHQFDLADLDVLADKAVSLNATPNRNVYISAGLRRIDIPGKSRATDKDVISCVACWADFDADGALDAAIARCSDLAISPNIIVITGEYPHRRGQLWWVLDEPCDDLQRHRLVQQALAKILGGDPTVTNPSRIMRVCGTVAWPIKQGRRLEVTGPADAPVRMANYYIDEIEAALMRSGMDTKGGETSLLDFNSTTNNGPVDVQTALVEGLKSGQFHHNMRAAVASMLAQSTPPRVVYDTIAAMVRKEGINVEERLQDLGRLVHGGIERGIYKPPSPQVDVAELKKRFRFAGHADLIERDPPDWSIEKFITRKSLAAIYAPPASFKTFIALDMALSIATGIDWHGHAVAPGKVLYVAAEGSGSFGFRVQAWANVRHGGAIVPRDRFAHLGEDVNMLSPDEMRAFVEAIQEQMDGLDLVVVDTVARNFGSGDENSTKDMVGFVNNMGRLQKIIGAGILMVHHTGKDESKGARGSSALHGALDHAFRLRREEGSDRVKLLSVKQKDADEAPPLWLKLGRVEVTHPKTGEVRDSLVPVATQADEGVPATAMNPEAYDGLRAGHMEVLSAIRANSGQLSTSGLAATLKRRSDNVARSVRLLMDRGLVLQRDGFLYFVPAQPQGEKQKENQEDDEF